MPYEPHEDFSPPPATAPILRYMSFVKFVSLLSSETLHFTRVDNLGDRFEGSMSRANLRARDAGDPRTIGRAPEMRAQLEAMRRTLPQSTYVNCWTRGGYESVAIWRMYVGDANGVAIESTFRRMVGALEAEAQRVFVGKVKYIDFDQDVIPEDNAYQPFMHKRKSFEYEKEVRALTSWFLQEFPHDEGAERIDVPPPPHSMNIRADLNQLILRVRVSPVSPVWFTGAR